MEGTSRRNLGKVGAVFPKSLGRLDVPGGKERRSKGQMGRKFIL
jgi:hypothetical protein